MRRLFLAALAVIITSCGPTGPQNPDGFKPRNEEKAVGTLRGRLLAADGNPRGGRLFLLDKKQSVIAKTEVAADGLFKLDTPLVGLLTLVLNDGRGSGVVTEITMYAAGVNDLGDLTSGLLEKTPRILSLTGVGYEERRTQGAGDFSRPLYSADGLWVYTFRKLAGQTKYELLKIELTTGAETVLATALTLDSSSALQLLSDKVISYRALAQGAYARFYLDVKNGNQIYEGSSVGFGPSGQWVFGDKLFIVDAVDRKATVSSLFGTQYRYRWNVVKVDLATKAVVKSALLNPGFHDHFAVMQASADQILFAPTFICHLSSGQTPAPPPDCPAASDSDALRLSAVELSALTIRPLTSFPLSSTFMSPVGPSVSSALTPDGLTLVMAIDHSNTHRLVQVSAMSGLQSPFAAGTGRTVVQARPDSKAVLLRVTTAATVNGMQTTRYGFSELLLGSGAITPVSANVTIDGASYGACPSGSYSCTATYRPSGNLRITDYLAVGSRSALVVDVLPTGSVGRVFPLAETDGLTELVSSPDGQKDVAVVRDSGGFLQLHTGASGGQFSAMSQLSFVTAQHSQPRVSNDGLWVHYFTRDPSSGYQQLFRVSLTP